MPFRSPGDLPNPGMEPRSPTLQADPLLSEPPGKSTEQESLKSAVQVGAGAWFCLFCVSVETGVWCQDRETLSQEEAATLRPSLLPIPTSQFYYPGRITLSFEAVQTGCVWPYLVCSHHLAPYPPAVPGSLFSKDPLPLSSVPVWRTNYITILELKEPTFKPTHSNIKP